VKAVQKEAQVLEEADQAVDYVEQEISQVTMIVQTTEEGVETEDQLPAVKEEAEGGEDLDLVKTIRIQMMTELQLILKDIEMIVMIDMNLVVKELM
jgi:hypothetical protein